MRQRKEHRVWNVGVDFCFTRTHNVGDTLRSRRILAESLLEFPRPFHAGWISMNESDPMKTVVLIRDVDRAPVGQPVHGKLGDTHQVRLVIQRRCQNRARLGEKRQPLGIGLRLGPRDPFVDQQLVAFFFCLCALDKVANLVSDRVKHLKKFIIGLDDFAVVKGHHAVHVATDPNRKGESSMQADALGDRRAREIRIGHNVIDPGRLSTGQDAADEINSGKQDRLAARLLEFVNLTGRHVPASFHVQCVRIRIHTPQLTKFPTHGLAYVLQQLGCRFRKAGRFGQSPCHSKLSGQSAVGFFARRNIANDRGVDMPVMLVVFTN